MGELAFDLDENDDIGFVHGVKPIVAGVCRVVEPVEVYLVKIDSWFGDNWLGFSNKLLGKLGVHNRKTLRVPPFVPARVRSQRYFRRARHEYEQAPSSVRLHIEQASEDNRRRLMSTICPQAAVFWWSGDSRRNRRGSLMAYLPTREGHTGWYAEFRQTEEWTVANTLRTTAQELSDYAADDRDHSIRFRVPAIVR